MRLSPHFTLREFTSTWRPEYARNVELASRGPHLANMMRLCADILEPLRDAFHGAPVRISSGFRYAEHLEDGWHGLDVAIRGDMPSRSYLPRSQHTRGEAADIHVAGVTERDVWEWIWRRCPAPFGQVILEHGQRSTWVHVSIPGRRIVERGGGPIYGEVVDWTGGTYTTIDRVDRWGGRGAP